MKSKRILVTGEPALSAPTLRTPLAGRTFRDMYRQPLYG